MTGQAREEEEEDRGNTIVKVGTRRRNAKLSNNISMAILSGFTFCDTRKIAIS